MKLSFKAQNPLEWIALTLKMLPEPLAHSHLYYIVSRAVLEANQAGIFKALDKESMTIKSLAQKCSLNERALTSLLTCLAPAGYFDFDGTNVSLSKMSRKWMAPSSSNNLDMQLQLNLITWDWMAQMGDFLRTGKGVQYHDTFNSHEWDVYQQAMAAGSGMQAREVAKKVPMPSSPTEMLDIGGSHGMYSAEICKRFPALKATVSDLPQAVEKAAPLLAALGMGDRVKHQAGDALKESFGENKYDFILCANLMHHFSPEENADLTRRAAKALKPSGYFAILEFIRPKISRKGDMLGGTLDLFFALSSTAGTWSVAEMQAWQKQAGLKPYKVQKFMTMPGFANVIAQKP